MRAPEDSFETAPLAERHEKRAPRPGSLVSSRARIWKRTRGSSSLMTRSRSARAAQRRPITRGRFRIRSPCAFRSPARRRLDRRPRLHQRHLRERRTLDVVSPPGSRGHSAHRRDGLPLRTMSVIGSSARTDTGRRRRRNEDALVCEPPLFAVADGMGGAQAGEVASSLRPSRCASRAKAAWPPRAGGRADPSS